ncbi:hypothetical protein HDV03_003913 [Kappamyces sp. JEL0829]|nr:hypothetical protein HDV03_003913 [Kappamyces sp. JEL0829]
MCKIISSGNTTQFQNNNQAALEDEFNAWFSSLADSGDIAVCKDPLKNPLQDQFPFPLPSAVEADALNRPVNLVPQSQFLDLTPCFPFPLNSTPATPLLSVGQADVYSNFVVPVLNENVAACRRSTEKPLIISPISAPSHTSPTPCSLSLTETDSSDTSSSRPKKRPAEVPEPEAALALKRHKQNEAAKRSRNKKMNALQTAQVRADVAEDFCRSLTIRVAVLEQEKKDWMAKEQEMRSRIALLEKLLTMK